MKRGDALDLEIQRLHQKGMSQVDIARTLNIMPHNVWYALNRERAIKETIIRFRNLPKETKKVIYEKKKPYLRKYLKKRYSEDESFRKKLIARSRERYKKLKEEIKTHEKN